MTVAASGEEPANLQAIELRDLLTRQFPRRGWLLKGLLQDRDLAMIHGARGVGKTRLVHRIAYAVASGGTFLRYVAPQAAGILLVDGETPREDLQERLAGVVATSDREATQPFRVLGADLLDAPLPSLATPAGHALVERHLDDVRLLILDNLSTLSDAPENDADAWWPLQRWLLDLRRRGVATMLVHHDNRAGGQRGTSRREDVLSHVLHLRRPADYCPSQGCRFEAHLTKGRAITGEAALPFEAWLRPGADGSDVWTHRAIAESRAQQIRELWESGVTRQRDIATELGFGLGTVARTVKRLRAEGVIT